MSISIISLNVRGLKNREKRRAIFDFYRKRADVLCLQETHSDKESCEQWTAEWGGKTVYSHGENNARGTALFIKKAFPCEYSPKYIDNDGRYIIGELDFAGVKIALGSIYAPNTDSPGFHSQIFEMFNSCTE